jgi:hypothetical protein
MKLKRWYCSFNRKYFNGELPEDLQIWWEPLGPNAQETVLVVDGEDGNPPELAIKVDPSMAMFPKLTKLLLLHECIHVKLWPRQGVKDHGRLFDEEMQRLLSYQQVRKLI